MCFKMRFTSLVAVSVFSVSCLAHAATSADLSTGRYFGWGDGSTVELHVESGAKFDIYAVQGVNKVISLHDFVKNGVKNSGTLTRLGKGHYHLLLNTTPYEHKKCVYSLRYKPKYTGWSLRSLNKACVWYHGTSWGYGTVSDKHLMKKGG